MKRSVLSCLMLLLLCGAAAQSPARLSISKESGIYEKGERVTVTCRMDAGAADSLTVRILLNNQLAGQYKVLPAAGVVDVLDRSFDETCAVMVEVQGPDMPAESIGFVVAPEGFRPGYEEPADLMDYWDNQKKQLESLPMQVKAVPLEVPASRRGEYTCQNIEINCLGPAPVRAYFAKPEGAEKKSLPIIILCRAAGVSGDWCRCQVGECVGNAALGHGALSLDLNAHGMLNGQSDAYYQLLEKSSLNNYWSMNISDRETCYFRGMYLRLLRAIEFMTRQPEWDGRRILIVGESQGGGQAAAAAGLDHRVSAVVLNVPAMQDLGGARAGRLSGWPQLIEGGRFTNDGQLDAVLPYFDGALLLRHSQAEIFCEMGLIDTTCPPSSVWSSLNGAPGRKTIRCVPFRTHAWPSGALRSLWDEKYYRPRLAFMERYLE